MSTDPLTATVQATHDHVLAALAEPERDGPAAVAWCSAHLVAADRVLYGAASRRSHTPLGDVRSADHLLQQAVNRLDRRLTGDTHLDRVPVQQVAGEVRSRLEAHAAAEARVVQQLLDAVDDDEAQALADRLSEVTSLAPTRPHPHTPHSPASGLVGRLDAAVDRVRDVLDNRTASTGRPLRPPRPLGRWGSYLMGRPPPSD